MGLFTKKESSDVVLTENGKSSSVSPSAESPNGKEGGVFSNEQHVPTNETEMISSDAQAGVQAVEAAAQVWTKWHLMAAYSLYVSRDGGQINEGRLY